MALEMLSRRLPWWLIVERIGGCFVNSYRHLTHGEVSTALRPFYFSVHPDLFGQYPSERAINESSLQVLSSYIQTLQQNRHPNPTTITFYLRPQQGKERAKGSLKSVKIKLSQRDLRNTVVSILSTCDLPTTYVDKIKPDEKPKDKFRGFKFTSEASQEYQSRPKEDPRNLTLYDWLRRNSGSAKEKLKSCEPVREDVVKLQKILCDSLKLKGVFWDCGWNITHFRGCLQAFQALTEHHADDMSVLKGRTLVFGNDTGVSLDGFVLLNSGEVRHNWLDFIKNMSKEFEVLKSVPAFEKAMSRVLKDIQIVRRKFQPKTMANQYEMNLRRLTTSLMDYQGTKGFPRSWPASLSDFELVVETGAGPLMVSPTGQFIVPCSCPSFLLVNFISEQLHNATKLLQEYKSHKEVEKTLHEVCTSVFNLVALDKDDSVTPKLMISCLESLLKHRNELAPHLYLMRLTITNYYSVMSDGQMCIPWNWKDLESSRDF